MKNELHLPESHLTTVVPSRSLCSLQRLTVGFSLGKVCPPVVWLVFGGLRGERWVSISPTLVVLLSSSVSVYAEVSLGHLAIWQSGSWRVKEKRWLWSCKLCQEKYPLYQLQNLPWLNHRSVVAHSHKQIYFCSSVQFEIAYPTKRNPESPGTCSILHSYLASSSLLHLCSILSIWVQFCMTQYIFLHIFILSF